MGNFNRGNRSNRSRDDRRSSGRSFSNRGSDRPEMHEAICAECGNTCQVPFKPTSSKPVYCNDCFGGKGDRKDNFRRSNNRNFSARGSDRPEMHEAICAECGNTCQVPFKPTSDKSVYCDDCFGAHRGKDSGRGNRNNQGPKFNEFKQKFDDLNAKLDKIIELLSPPAVKKTAKSEKIEKAEKTATKPKAKKVAVKKKK